jgi:hypothetical protein
MQLPKVDLTTAMNRTNIPLTLIIFSQASTNLKKCEKIQEDIVQILTSHKTKSPNPTILKSSSFEAAIVKNSARSLVNQSLSTGGCNVNLPADMFSTSDDDTTFVMMVRIMKNIMKK